MHPLRMSSVIRAARRFWYVAAIWSCAAPVEPALGQSQDAQGLIRVRYSEGTVHGFLELRDTADRLIAHGDLLQVPGDSTIESRMVFRFTDGSSFEETTVFSQHRVFRMEHYHLVQRGPAFEADLDATLGRGGRYVVITTSHGDGKVERDEGQLDLPDDVYDGMPVLIAKNLRKDETVTVHLVAFTPKPRLIGLRISHAGTDTVMRGDHAEPVAHLVLSPQLGALTGFFASLLGKHPPDSDVWVVTAPVPAFVRFEGPLYTGAVWRLMLVAPTWPSAGPRPH